ncbi:response regulator [Myxacorys almedinensis]|uniref:histidine kinase n=1 Tax=Myxacorys almedinensis A TaxID=2690445 RepID=A0A8J8CGZ3_9CYAN|nr:response regulator [Myxacorys almedinensis]NDJ16114.1 response regulator [Myxacorys almedinensis A]
MRILVVEDDQLIVEALTIILVRQNYAIEVATDGQTAWSLIERFEYDLLLLDVTLPNLDGMTLCRQVRAKGLTTPILLLTGRDSGHDKAIGLDAGADDYVVKPFDHEELVARIRALLRRGGALSQPILEWGALQFDPSSCDVRYANQPLNLTPKEYGMLELFLRNSRRVFSCDMILEHLWSYDEMPGAEAVRTHIKGLRQKLKAAGANADLIETVYGIGYRLKPLVQPEPHKLSPAVVEESETQTTTQQQTLRQIAAVWERFRGRVSEQVAVLEQAIAAATLDTLTADLKAAAVREAHTLAGSLGTFGLSNGSAIARRLEQTLQSTTPLTCSDMEALGGLLSQLRHAVDHHVTHNLDAGATSAPLPPSPLVLIVGREAQPEGLIQQLQPLAAPYGITTIAASGFASARKTLYHDHPNAVLVDASGSAQLDESLALIAELNQRKPPVPVLLLADQTDVSDRIHLSRSGKHTLLSPSLPIEQIFGSVLRALSQADPSETQVLAVDDDPNTLAVLQTLLQPWGLRVTTLADPRKFWQTLESVAPDLLILDVEMPYFSGTELCQTIRNDSRWSELPIVFLTVHNDAEMINHVFTVGADDFVSKPIVGSELVTRIVNRLQRHTLACRVAQLHRSRSLVEPRIAQNPTQDALKLVQARLATIIDIADDAIICTDQTQRITLFNQGAENIFGYAAHEALGQPLDLLLPVASVQAHRQHVKAFGRSRQPACRMGERQEIYGRRKDGSEFPAEASISQLKAEDTIIYTVYLRDVSDRKQIERMKDEFVSVVSHELRTPLTSIHGSLKLLASGLLSAESERGKRLLHIAVESTNRLVHLINDILDIERIESGQVKMETVACQLLDLIAAAVTLMQPLAEKAGITLLVTSLPVDLRVDRDRIIQTLTNLLSNAIKCSSVGTTVWLKTALIDDPASPRSRVLLVTVEDKGCGIPADKLEVIFERFQQADSSDSRHHDGTGLGLPICRSIVEQHGGRIWVESVVGEGSIFYFTIPLPSGQSNDLEDNLEGQFVAVTSC